LGTIRIDFGSRGGKRAIKNLQNFSRELERVNSLINQSGQSSLKNLSTETKEATQEANKLANSFDEVSSSINKAAQDTERLSTETLAFGAAVSGGVAAGVGAVFANGLQGFAQFEQYQAVLENTLGSAEAADQALSRIEKFAATTPFQLDEVVEGFIKLQNRGIEPTNEVLTQLGDIASSQGKQLDQIVEAVLDAQTGEFERLKEFGITAETAGNQVTLAFKGVTQEVEKTPEALAAAVISLGALEGVAGQMATQSEILVGRFSNLQDETGKATRAFGEFAAVGARPVVEAAIGLLQTFNNLPGPIQSTLIATTGFTGVLAAAVATIAAYNLANGKRIKQELLAATATVRGNAALAAKNATTSIATTLTAAYATATGTATAAQSAQTAATIKSATALGLVAGALASVAIAVDTFRTITASTREADEAVKGIQDSLNAVREAAGNLPDNLLGDEATQNLQAAQNELNAVQRNLDIVRGVIPGLSTAAESAARGTTIAFGEVSLAVGEVEGAAINTLRGIAQGASIPAEEIDATIAAIDNGIAALEAQEPVLESDIAIRDKQIERLEDYKNQLNGAADENENVESTTEQLTERVNDLNDALQRTQDELANAASAREAAIKEDIANGIKSLEEGEARIAASEERLLNERIASARDQIAELQAAKAQTEDPDALAEVNAEILALETQINNDRIAIADQRIQAQKEADREAENSAKEAAKAREEAAKEAEQAEKDRLAATLETFDKELARAQEVASIRIELIDQQIEANQRQQDLLSQQASLDSTLIELDRERLETALARAEATENETEVERIKGEIAAVNRDAIAQEFESKRLSLELAQAQSEAEAQRAVVLAEVAVTEARIATQKAQAQGASSEEISNLQQIEGLQQQNLQAAKDVQYTIAEIGELKSQELDAQEQIANENQKQSEFSDETADTEERKADAAKSNAGSQKDAVDLMEEQSRLAQEIADAEEKRTSQLIRALSTQEKSTEESLKQLNAIRENFKEARRAGLFSEVGGELEQAAKQLERILERGGDTGDLIDFAQNNDSAIAQQLLEGVGRGDVIDLIEADQAFEEGGDTAAQSLEGGIVSGAERAAGILEGAIANAPVGGGAIPISTPSSLPSFRSGGTLQPGVNQVHRDEYIVSPGGGESVISQARSRAITNAANREVGRQTALMERMNRELVQLRQQVAKPKVQAPANYTVFSDRPLQDAVDLEFGRLKTIAAYGGW